MLPMLPMALTMAMAAAFLAAGRGIVLEIQASMTNPEAKPAAVLVRICHMLEGPLKTVLVMRNIAK